MITQKIFIDTSFFYAFIDRADLNHLKTVAIFNFLAQNHYQIYTSSLVIMAAYNRMVRDVGTAVSNDFFQAVLESHIEILYPTRTELLSAMRMLKSSNIRQVPLTELINSSIMTRHSVRNILTFDFWNSSFGTSVSAFLNT